jgi:argininosuccinate lyase
MNADPKPPIQNEKDSKQPLSSSLTQPSDQTSQRDKPASLSAPGDHRLFAAEIRASTAYAEALVEAGVLTNDERETLVKALEQIASDHDKDRKAFDLDNGSLFDVIDTRLNAIAGSASGKLNRSGNERMATALRLWLLDEMQSIGESVAGVQRALVQQAEGHVATLMPGYTHLQPAQVVSCSHWLLSYFWMLTRDQERLTSALGRTSVSPLGSGALAGTRFRLDRKALAASVGFGDVTQNSMDAVSDMDFAAEFLFIAAMIGVHLSRLAEDLILYSNPALGFVTIDDAYTSGSATLPHKRNPHGVELSRGKAGRLLGDLLGFLSTLKALPSTYNQDTQENRQTLFEAVNILNDMLTIMEGVVRTLTIHPDRMWDALDEKILAGDLADYLVERGVGFRAACEIVDKLINKAEKMNMPLSELDLDDYKAESPAFDADVFAVFDYARSAAQRAALGGTAPAAIRSQIRQALNWLVNAGLE